MKTEKMNHTALAIMSIYRPRGDQSWEKKLPWLWLHDATKDLLYDVINSGNKITEPVLLSKQGFVIDGHKRIAVGSALCIDVPVKFKEPS